jgi:N6-adenosine-specific RNA methylase IME4
VRKFASEADKRTHVRQLNLARRHLNQAQRRVLVADELRERPERSNNQIAQTLGVDDKTVAATRMGLEATSEIPKLDRTVGRDGKTRPAARPKLAQIDLGADGQQATLGSAKAIRAERGEERRAARIQRIAAITNNNAALPTGQQWPIILADPPWRYEHPAYGLTRDVEEHYPTLTLEDICALPVSRLAMSDSLLFLWVPPPILEQAFAVIRAWSFDYRTGIVWVKQWIGMGNYVRQQHEHLLIARRGNFPTPHEKDRPSSIISAPRREHSRKPDQAYELIERMYPTLPKIELFARDTREGWAAWGNEAPAAMEAAS